MTELRWALTPDGFKETAEWSVRMFRGEEAAEGMAAFREKRDAGWVDGQG